MKEIIKERLENEFKTYKERVLTLDSQKIFDKSYETAIKQEIASSFTDGLNDDEVLEFLARFDSTEKLLDYLYDLWLDADGGIDSEIFDTLEMELQ
ncbi:MAG: DUF3848 domain-containing protein [Lachnospiraceae bacterium]|nr:DUF3848 domain-containing protein [Lachnospiraceae bacterium]